MGFSFLIVAVALFSVSCAQLPPACTDSLQGILNATILLGESAYNVSSQCPGPNCQADVNALSNAAVKLVKSIQTVITSCGGSESPVCAKRLDMVADDLGVVAQDAANVATQCNGPNVTQQECSVAVQELSGDVARAVTDLITAISICSTAPQKQLLSEAFPALLTKQRRRILA